MGGELAVDELALLILLLDVSVYEFHHHRLLHLRPGLELLLRGFDGILREQALHVGEAVPGVLLRVVVVALLPGLVQSLLRGNPVKVEGLVVILPDQGELLLLESIDLLPHIWLHMVVHPVAGVRHAVVDPE